MADLKPPRGSAGERETLLSLLRYQRESLVRKVTGVDEAAARASAVPSGTTLPWLVKHLTAAEVLWVLAHLLEETARPGGHADILRELIDGSTGR